MSGDERVAVLESKQERTEKDVSRLFKFFREHMIKEEEDRDLDRKDRNNNREEIIALVGGIDNKLNSQKSFWAGMMFAFTSVWAIIAAAIVYLKGG